LGIDDVRARSSLTALFFGSDLLTQSVMNFLPGSVETPTAVIIVDGAPGRELVGDVPPLAAGPDEVEYGVDDIANVHRTSATAGHGRRDQGSDASPLGIGEVGGIRFPIHPFGLPLNLPSHTGSKASSFPRISNTGSVAVSEKISGW
jgi:hypothetical protein